MSETNLGSPMGWAVAKVAELGRVQLGRQRAPQHHSGQHMRPYLRSANVFENRIDTRDVLEMNFSPDEFENYRLHPGDILLNEGQSRELVGRPAIFRNELPGACFQNTLVRYQCHQGLLPEFALYTFRWYMRSGVFQSIAQWSTNIAHLGAARFGALPMGLPPLAEQRRIVAKLDALLALIHHIREEIQKVRSLIETCRQMALEKMLSAAQTKWPIVRFGNHIMSLSSGTASVPVDNKTSRPILRSSSVRPFYIDLADVRYLDESITLPNGYLLVDGDVLFTRLSGSADYVGNCAVVTGLSGRAVYFSDRAFRAQVNKDLEPYFVAICFNSPSLRRILLTKTKSTAGHQRISMDAIRDGSFPLPSLDEQKEIVRRIESLFARADALSAEVKAARERLDVLEQAVLAKAFRGELVPQDPSDEPASVLLERIRAERAAGGGEQPGRKRGRAKKE